MPTKFSVSSFAVILCLLFLLVTVSGCDLPLNSLFPGFDNPDQTSSSQAAATQPLNSHDGSVMDYVSLLGGLRAQKIPIMPNGEISQPFFTVKGKNVDVRGENVQVFEYMDTNAAEADAARISPDGGSIGTSMVSWMNAPHFYKKGKLIVLYVGSNKQVIAVLESLLGQQFAGR